MVRMLQAHKPLRLPSELRLGAQETQRLLATAQERGGNGERGTERTEGGWV